jgi:hypothetical protein
MRRALARFRVLPCDSPTVPVGEVPDPVAESSRLPSGWATVRIDEAGAVRLGRQRSPDKHTGRHATKYVRAANITSEGLDLTDLLEMDFTPGERTIFALHVGDVLLTEASGSAAQAGRAALWRGDIDDCCYQNTVIRFRPHVTRPEYALVVFRHYSASGVFARAARRVGIQHLGASRFAELAFPLPPLSEQRRIAEVTERRLREICEADDRLRSALTHLGEQVREILAAAASGELVEQRTTAVGLEGPVVPEASAAQRGRSQSKIQGSLFDSVEQETGEADKVEEPLPRGWRWARVENVGEVTLGRQRSPRHQHGVHMRPYLRVANVFEDRIDTSDILRMNFEPEEVATYVRFVARINSRAQSAPRSDIYVRRTYSGRPSSSMRFSEATAMATSVVCRPSVRERSASPITRL